MAWDKTKPAGADKIKDSDDNIRLNNDAIETVLGTNITVGPTTIQGAIQGDTTKGRIFRIGYLRLDNGSNASTIKCTFVSRWNGDTIAETDNVAKNATTGNFILDAGGLVLQVDASGLTGNAIAAIGALEANASTASIFPQVYASGNNFVIRCKLNATGAVQDVTVLVDTGIIDIAIQYVTSA